MYLSFSEKFITDFSDEDITKEYSHGFLFTRKSKGSMYQTRSLRIDLSQFTLSSENKRILNKNQTLILNTEAVPVVNYNWHVHSLAKEFYSTKFGDNTFSASKVKELLTLEQNSNFNLLLKYSLVEGENIGYAISYQNNEILHYSYPFYSLEIPKEQSIGMGMMLKAIQWSLEQNKKYIYLGSISESASKYKLQFNGLEWWDNENQRWSSDIEAAKELLN